MSASLAMISLTHMIVAGVVILLLFGAKRIPELMRSLGSGMNQFKRGMQEAVDPPEEERKP